MTFAEWLFIPIVKVITHRLYFISVANCLLLPKNAYPRPLVKTISSPQPTIQMANRTLKLLTFPYILISMYSKFYFFERCQTTIRSYTIIGEKQRIAAENNLDCSAREEAIILTGMLVVAILPNTK